MGIIMLTYESKPKAYLEPKKLADDKRTLSDNKI